MFLSTNVMNEAPNVNVEVYPDLAYNTQNNMQQHQQQGTSHQELNNTDNSINGATYTQTGPVINYLQQHQLNGLKNPNYTNSPVNYQFNPLSQQLSDDMKHLTIGQNTAIAQNQRLNAYSNQNSQSTFSTSTPERSVPTNNQHHTTRYLQQHQQQSLSLKSNISPIAIATEKIPQSIANVPVGRASYYSNNQQTLPFPNNRPIVNGDLPQQSRPPILPQIQQAQNITPPYQIASSAASVQQQSRLNTIHGKRYPTQPIPNQPSQPTIQAQYVQTEQPLPYQQQTQSVASVGFNRLWTSAAETFDLLHTPNILPPQLEPPPSIQLPSAPHQSESNCSPDVFRCTLTKIPESAALLHKSRLPLGVLIHPFKDLTQLAVIQCSTIVRCRSCRTYINPFVYFVDNKRWKCNLCYRVNELPEEFQYDPVTKTYGDPSRRPEVRASTIEYIAPAEYMLRPPQPAVYLFLLDISRAALESGYLHTICSILVDELDHLPGDARTQLGFLAFDTTLHFYSLPESSSGNGIAREMIVWDVDDPFLPCPDNLLVNLQSRKEIIRDLLRQLPTRYANSYENGSCLGAALQAAHKMMAGTGGRVTVFQATLPTVGPGALAAREDPNLRAGSSGATQQLLNPANDFYKRLALECSGQQIAVDLFLVNSQYVDVATVSGISKFSGGTVYHFPLYKMSNHVQQVQLNRTLKRYLTRKIGFEAVMRVRCSRGLAIHAFHGHFFVRSTDLLSLPNVSPDAAFGMQVSIEESLSDAQTVCFQAALLYTSSKAERRIRVHTLCIPVANTLTDIIHSADQQAILSLLAKMAVDRSLASSLSDAKDACLNAAIDILSSYKMSQNLSTGTGSLIAPKCLRLLPLYITALMRHPAFRVGVSTRLDDRIIAMCDLKTQSVHMVMLSAYPDLYSVHDIALLQKDVLPARMQLSARSIDRTGAYLMDCGVYMMLLVCPQVDPAFVRDLGLTSATISARTDEPPLVELLDETDGDNDVQRAFRTFVDRLNEDRPTVVPILWIKEDHLQHRQLFLERLVEDRMDSALSYHEFLQHLRSQVK